MSGPLSGIRVLDLGQVYNGPYCTLLLAHLGADVIKIEPPNGEPVRRRRQDGSNDPAFALLNGGKRSLVLNLKSTSGVELFLRLVEHADVVVENFGPGVMERLGLSFEHLSAHNSGIILASGKGYRSSSTHRNYLAMDLTVQAMAGVLSATGFPDAPPVKSGAAVADFSAASHLTIGILAAIIDRSRTGMGRRVEVAMMDAVLPTLTSGLAAVLSDDGVEKPERTGNRHGGLEYCPYNVYEAADGWVAILCLSERHWRSLCSVMHAPELVGDDRYMDNTARVQNMDEVDEIVHSWARSHRRQALLDLLQEEAIPAAPVRTLREVLGDRDLVMNSMIHVVGTDRVFGNPIQLGNGEVDSKLSVPALGQDTESILRDLMNIPDDEITRLRAQGVI